MNLTKTEDWNVQGNSNNPIPYFKVDPIVVLIFLLEACWYLVVDIQ
jgi:hypothetical protein